MQKSLIIARLIGPVLSAIGIGMLVNQPTYREMAAQFLGGLPFIYFSGILALVAGLYILNVHNVWTPDWRSAVTAVGLVPDLCRRVPDHRAAVLQLSSPAQSSPTAGFSSAPASFRSRSAT